MNDQVSMADDAVLVAAMVDSSPDPVFAIRPSGRLVFANAALRGILGIERSDVGSVNVFDHLPPQAVAVVRPMLDEMLTRPPGEAMYDEMSSRSLGWFSIGAKSHPAPDGSIGVIAGSVRDITVQKRQQEELEAAQKRLLESNRDLQDFAYVASHDLQEPLRKIMAFGDRLAHKYEDELDEQAKDYLGRMQNAAGRMQVLIDDLLMFSRVSTRGGESEPTDLGEVVRGVLGDLEIAIAESGARIELGELPVLPADPSQMRQLFQNLIGNALKFRRAEVAPVVRVSASSQGPSWRIVVMDNGIGFDQQYAEKIFTVFQRLHGRSEYDGSGIGLSVCRRIVERHEGTIAASSVDGEGAVFTITLPDA
ncbi:MAG: ATP-binding protein [Actinomycetota bacterium]